MNNTTPKNTWITGASSGIGQGMAEMLASRGDRVFVSSRSEESLSGLASKHERMVVAPCDITDQASVADALAQIGQQAPQLDRIILNAGNCEYLDFPDPDWSAVRRVMETNFFGTVNCLQAALPLLRSGPRGAHIVVIGSQVTAAPFARAEAYGASKAALRYFCDSLRIDLAGEGMDVTLVNPGFVDTPLTRRNDFPMPFLVDAPSAARRIVDAIESRPRVFSFPRRLSALLLLSKLMPRAWQKMVAADARGVSPEGESGK